MAKSYELTTINDFTYNLKINGDFEDQLYYTINKMLKSSYYDDETNSIFFSAENVIPFKQYLLEQQNNKLSHSKCVKLIDDLSKQIFFLNKCNFGFYGFDIEDILTIDNTFIFCSTQNLLPLENDCIIFTSPINQPYFSNPELFKLTSLPFEINTKCCYYSLGALVVFSLLNTYLLVGNELKSTEEIESILTPFLNTKIYWFIKRCLEPKVEKRILLLI